MMTPVPLEYKITIPSMGIVIDNIFSLSRPMLEFNAIPAEKGGFKAGPFYVTPLKYAIELSKHNIHGKKLAEKFDAFDLWLDAINSKTKEVKSEFLLEGCYVKEIQATYTADIDFVEVTISVSTLNDCMFNRKLKNAKNEFAYNRAMEVLDKKHVT